MTREEMLKTVETYGLLRKKQGQAEGLPDGWCAEPYDLRCDADELLVEIECYLLRKRFEDD